MSSKLFHTVAFLTLTLTFVLGIETHAREVNCFTISKEQGIQACKNVECIDLKAGDEQEECNTNCENKEMPKCETKRAHYVDPLSGASNSDPDDESTN